jgi:hypothetical protein
MKKITIAFFALALIAGFAFAIEKPATALQNSILQPKPPFSSIKVQTPNGGETWVKGGIGIVTWTTVNVAQNVNIILKATNVFSGGEFPIAKNIAPNAGKVVYGIPTNIGYDGKVFKVIISTVDGKVRDESNDTFTLRPMELSATLSAFPTTFTGACPATINFKGFITAEYPCEVTYFFGHNDGTKSANYKVTVAAGKPQAVSYSRQVAQSGSGHVTLFVVAPVAKSSNTAFFTVTCK